MRDTIYRQDAIDAMRKLPKWNVMREDYKNVGFSYDDVMFTLDKLPSAQPKRKTARWEVLYPNHTYKYHCSGCGANHKYRFDFCPSCGAYMNER